MQFVIGTTISHGHVIGRELIRYSLPVKMKILGKRWQQIFVARFIGIPLCICNRVDRSSCLTRCIVTGACVIYTVNTSRLLASVIGIIHSIHFRLNGATYTPNIFYLDTLLKHYVSLNLARNISVNYYLYVFYLPKICHEKCFSGNAMRLIICEYIICEFFTGDGNATVYCTTDGNGRKLYAWNR